MARGRYIALCDHDDIWNDRHLEVLLNCLESYPAAALAFDNAEYFGASETVPRLHLKPQVVHLFLKGRVTPEVLLWYYPVATMSVVMFKRGIFEKMGGLNDRILALDDLHFYLRLAARQEIRYVDYVGCQKRVTDDNLSQQVNMKEINVQYLEDLWQNHPEVVTAIGPINFRFRLARKYFKLGRQYEQNGDPYLAKEMFWSAYKANAFNLRYLWCAARCDSSIPNK